MRTSEQKYNIVVITFLIVVQIVVRLNQQTHNFFTTINLMLPVVTTVSKTHVPN